MPDHVGDRLGLFYVKEFPLGQNILYSGHLIASTKIIRYQSTKFRERRSLDRTGFQRLLKARWQSRPGNGETMPDRARSKQSCNPHIGAQARMSTVEISRERSAMSLSQRVRRLSLERSCAKSR